MGGLALIFFIGLYIFIARKLFKRFDGSRYKWLVIVLIVLVPTGDAVVGRLYLKKLCAEEGGLKVYRVAEHVEGFMNNDREYWIEEYGYQFSEDLPSNGVTTRYSKQNGGIVREVKVSPESQYRLLLKHFDQKKTYRYSQYLIEEIASGEILATQTQIGFNGGWVDKLIAAISDGGTSPAWCTYTEFHNPAEIVKRTLKHKGE